MLREHEPVYRVKLTRDIPIITRKHIGIIALILIAVVFGLMFPLVPLKFKWTIIMIVPAIIIAMYILKNPFFGVCCFFIYEFSRPDNFIPALRPLKIAMVIEITTLIAWLLYLIKTRKNIKWSNFTWIFLAFMFVIATTVITAVNNRYAYNTFELMIVYFIMFVISTNVVDSFKRLNILIWLLLPIHFYFALKGIYTGGLVGGGLMGDENDFALYLSIMIPFAFFLFIYSPGKIKKFFTLIILIALVLGVISSMSRGGWVGLMAVILFCILKSKQRLVSLGIVLLLAVTVISFASSEYWDEVKTISNIQESTAQARLDYWQAAVRMFIDYPITGVGAGNGGIRMPEYYTGPREAATQWGRTFHGAIPQIMGELGTLGLASYLLMIYFALRYLFRIQKQSAERNDNTSLMLANSIMGGIIGFLVNATFLSTAYYPQLWTLFTLTIILVQLEKIHPINNTISEN